MIRKQQHSAGDTPCDVVVIGSGLGGLACGTILARHGLKVCIVEQDDRPGGCLRTFRRGGIDFDTGFHYIGGLAPGQALHRPFAYLRLLDLAWVELDRDGFDEVVIGDRSFRFANGYDRFVDTLAESFPHQRQPLQQYAELLAETGRHLFDAFGSEPSRSRFTAELMSRSAYDYLQQTFSDPLLRRVVAGTSFKMPLDAERLPLYLFAQLNSSYIQSAWRLSGGGSTIVRRLIEQIVAAGGQVTTGARVTRLETGPDGIAAVHINDGDLRIATRRVVSSAHPAGTLALVDDTPMLRRIYRQRIASLANSGGFFTTHLRLKPDAMQPIDRNIYIHRADADEWHADYRAGHLPAGLLVSSYPTAPARTDLHAIDLLTPMAWAAVERWNGTRIGRRGDDYEAFKREAADACIRLAATRLPHLPAAIDRVVTSTPLTYTAYTGTPCGAAYGILKDCRSPWLTVLPARTPIPNLFFTGQSLNFHGLLGVTVTAFLTCAEILGTPAIARALEEAT